VKVYKGDIDYENEFENQADRLFLWVSDGAGDVSGAEPGAGD
jgi:hypothetical protein